MTAMDGSLEPSMPVRLMPVCPDVDAQLSQLHATLSSLLSVIDDDARQLDANLQDAHALIRNMSRRAEQFVNQTEAPTDHDLLCRFHALDKARVAESDAYEVFADDLECFRKRQLLSLKVAESDSDRHVLVKRRREYIRTLALCRDLVTAIFSVG